MSRFEIKMPKLGESITEGTIVSWSVQVGDMIEEDDVLFEVNTAKVSAEVPSPVAGKVVEILAKEGETIAVGTVVAIVDTEGKEDGESQPASGSGETSSPEPSSSATSKQEEKPKEKQEEKQDEKEDRWYSPIVLQLAKEAKIPRDELDKIPGTGYEGRLSKKDIKRYIEGMQQPKQPETAAPQENKPSKESPKETKPQTSKPFSSSSVEVKEMDYVRRLIADHMVDSKKTSPHVTNVVEVDVTRLVLWREKNKDAFFRKEGVKLTYMPVIAEAVAKALQAYPQVNASVDGYNILLKKHINIGIAVSLDDGNLVVPVVHDANRLNLGGLAVAIDTLAAKARGNKLAPEDIDGGTFTITNFGTFKSLFGTPIINQPEVAILGVGYIEKKPAVVSTPEGDVIAIRHKMYLSLSYDHRVIDGSLGGNFLRAVADNLEQLTTYSL